MFVISLSSCEQECTHANLSESKTVPTCTRNGETIYTCDDCGYSYKANIIEPQGHVFEENKVEATCTQGGYIEYSCRCGYSYTSDRISAIGHDFSDTITSADCTNAGYTTHKCNRCGYSYVSNQTDPIAHEYTKTVTPPSCSSQGYTTYSCSNCESEYISDHVAPIGHDLAKTEVSPDCTSEGKTTYSCQNCSYEYSETIKPLGHSFTKLVTMPTLSDMGFTDYKCERAGCGYSYVGDMRFYKDILPNGAYANNSTVLAKGIDVSVHNYANNNSIDFASIKASGIDFVIIRAGQSYFDNYTKGGVDAKFEQSYADAKAAGLDVGVYFYTYATNVNEIIQDARLLISILEGKQFEYPIYLDLEDPSLENIDPSIITEMCMEFFTILQRAGYYTGLYINNAWLQNHIQTEVALSNFEIWYARYSETDTEAVWNDDLYGENLGMWQYSDEGSFDAIEGVPFDLNYAYKNYPEIIKANGFNGYGKDEIKFYDSDKIFAYVIANSLIIRSAPDFSTTATISGYAQYGDCLEVIEINEDYLKVKFQGKYAYVASNPEHISFKYPIK